MNLKDAKEMKKSVSEIIKNRTKCTKKLKNASKTSKVSVKNGKKMTKKQQEQMKKLNKFLLKFILIEYAVCAGVLLVANNIELIRQNKSQDEMIIKQQNIICNLTQANINLSNLNENSGDIKFEKKALKITDSDRELIAKLLYHEARGESLECQKAVVSVIINRLNSGKWGKTIKDVIYAKNQFEPVSRDLVERTKPLENQYKAIDYVLENGVTVPEWVQYFRADYHFDWTGYSQYCQLSHTYFGGFNI